MYAFLFLMAVNGLTCNPWVLSDLNAVYLNICSEIIHRSWALMFPFNSGPFHLSSLDLITVILKRYNFGAFSSTFMFGFVFSIRPTIFGKKKK